MSDYIDVALEKLVKNTGEKAALIQKIQSTAPSACGLEDCHNLERMVDVLLSFAWKAVQKDEETT